MKKKNLTRKTAVALASLMLLSAVPVNVYADATGEDGGTTGDAGMSVTKKEWFSIIMPTNTNLVSTLNFTLDPEQTLSNPNVTSRSQKIVDHDADVMQDWKRKYKEGATFGEGDKLVSLEVAMKTAAYSDYDPATHVYFTRVDFDHLYMGNGATNTAYDQWGPVVNREAKVSDLDDPTNGDSTKYAFGNKSNWIVVANRSAVPVSVELTTTWNSEGVEMVGKESDLDDTKGPQMYMAIERTDGYTTDWANGTVIGKRRDTTGNLLLGAEISQRKVTTYGQNPKLVYNLKTANQFTKFLGYDANLWQAAIPSWITTEHYPYQIKEIGGNKISVERNIADYEKQKQVDATTGDVVDTYTYPAYGFRLYGEINESAGWTSLEQLPHVQMTWVVRTMTAQDPVNTGATVDPRDYDLRGVVRDPLTLTVTHGTGMSVSTKVTDVRWEYDGKDMGTLITDPFVPEYSSEETTFVDVKSIMNTVDGKKVFSGKTEVTVNVVTLLNWGRNGFFIDKTKPVVINIYLDNDEYVSVNLIDSFGYLNQY